ncbi:MAG: folate-binding protein YgfZ [Acidimicrobiia bacterium]
MPSLTATPIERDIVIASGADAVTYLHTQLTQDIVGLAVDESAWSFILAPKSEIEALVRVTRSGSETVILDVGIGHGPAVRKRLDRMLFRIDVSFEEATWPGIAWRGPGAGLVESDAPISSPYPAVFPEAFDEVGPDVAAPAEHLALTDGEFESLRILAGWPGEQEFDGSTTPVMTGMVPYTVNFDKGCYTGQEFVARVHYRDAAPTRRLVHVSFDGGENVAPGDSISVDGEVVGSITSCEPEPGVGLGYLKRSVDIDAAASSGDISLAFSEISSK